MQRFSTAVVGVTFEGRQAAIRRCLPGQPVRVAHDPSNAYDTNAVGVYTDGGEQLGFLPAALAARLVAEYGAGFAVEGSVEDVLHHPKSWGLRVTVYPAGMAPVAATVAPRPDLGEWSLD